MALRKRVDPRMASLNRLDARLTGMQKQAKTRAGVDIHAIVERAMQPVKKEVAEHVSTIKYLQKLHEGILTQDIRRNERIELSQRERTAMFEDAKREFAEYMKGHGVLIGNVKNVSLPELKGIADKAILDIHMRLARQLLK